MLIYFIIIYHYLASNDQFEFDYLYFFVRLSINKRPFSFHHTLPYLIQSSMKYCTLVPILIIARLNKNYNRIYLRNVYKLH